MCQLARKPQVREERATSSQENKNLAPKVRLQGPPLRLGTRCVSSVPLGLRSHSTQSKDVARVGGVAAV